MGWLVRIVNRPDVEYDSVEAADEQGDCQEVVDVAPALRLPAD